MHISLNKKASKEFKELRERIAKQLGVDEEAVSASLVIHKLYKVYMSQKQSNF